MRRGYSEVERGKHNKGGDQEPEQQTDQWPVSATKPTFISYQWGNRSRK